MLWIKGDDIGPTKSGMSHAKKNPEFISGPEILGKEKNFKCERKTRENIREKFQLPLFCIFLVSAKVTENKILNFDKSSMII